MIFQSDVLPIFSETARTYLEKPRTAVGWRGLISDPTLSGAEDVPRGLALGRRVLLDVLAAGLPTAVEFLDPLVACPGGVCCGWYKVVPPKRYKFVYKPHSL